MNSIHELIAVFLQRGTCIESICLRKENQRYFCQDADFRSSPSVHAYTIHEYGIRIRFWGVQHFLSFTSKLQQYLIKAGQWNVEERKSKVSESRQFVGPGGGPLVHHCLSNFKSLYYNPALGLLSSSILTWKAFFTL